LEVDVEKFCRKVFTLLKEGGIFFGRTAVNGEKPIISNSSYLHTLVTLRAVLEKIGFKDVDVGETTVEYTIKVIGNNRISNFYAVKPNS